MAQRLEQRRSRHNDASEAGIAVLQKLRAVQEPLMDQERVATVTFINNGNVDALRSSVGGWKSLDAYLA